MTYVSPEDRISNIRAIELQSRTGIPKREVTACVWLNKVCRKP